MYQDRKAKPEVQPKAERRRLSAEYKRRIIEEAARCQHRELGSLLRREGLTYAQIANWRKAHATGRVHFTLVQSSGIPKAVEVIG